MGYGFYFFCVFFLLGKDEKKLEEAKEKYVIRDRLTRRDKYFFFMNLGLSSFVKFVLLLINI